MKEVCRSPKILQAGNKLIQLLSCKHALLFFQEKGRLMMRVQPWAQEAESWVQRAEPCAQEDYLQAFVPNRVFSVALWNCLGPETFLLSSTFFFHVCGISITVILCLSHHHTLWADNLFSSFTGLQKEGNFSPRQIILRFHWYLIWMMRFGTFEMMIFK